MSLDGIQRFLDKCPTAVDIDNTFVIHWSEPGVGFGTITFYRDEKGIHCDDECMGKDFIKRILIRLVDEVIIDE